LNIEHRTLNKRKEEGTMRAEIKCNVTKEDARAIAHALVKAKKGAKETKKP